MSEELVSCSDCGRSGKQQAPNNGGSTGRRGRGRARGRRKNAFAF